MKKRKLKQMPIVQPKEGEIERHNTYTRLNPKGHEELVIQKRGQDEETLNELANEIEEQLLEYMDMGEVSPALMSDQPLNDRIGNRKHIPRLVSSAQDPLRTNDDTITNMTGTTKLAASSPEQQKIQSNIRATHLGRRPRNKYITSPQSDGAIYGATHSESFTGTAGIAVAPVQYKVMGKKKTKKDQESRKMAEHNMKSIDDLLVEWEPEFKAGEYDPGDYKMPSPSGQGVAARNAKKDSTGSREYETKQHGDAWPRKHNETAAMCDVEESGVEDKPQGSHESTHATADDGIQSEVGHNWPNQPKHKGGGVGEPVSGTRYTDGGTLKGQAPHGLDNTGRKASLPKDGPITGTKGPQQGQPMEWSPERIGNLLGEDTDLQSLFDNYANKNKQVDLQSFQALCDAHGLGVVLDESSMLRLMATNRDIMFHEHVDSYGPYWVTESAANIQEMQIRSPEDEAFYKDDLSRTFDMDDDDLEDEMDMDQDGDYDAGHGRFGYEEETDGYCPECGHEGIDAECPACGCEMWHSENDIPDSMPEVDYEGFEEEGAGPSARGDQYWSYKKANQRFADTDEVMESIKYFMSQTKAILESNTDATKSQIAKALNSQWAKVRKHIHLESLSNPVRKTLHKLTQTFPGFTPVMRESRADAMDSLDGKSVITNKMKKSPDLADQPGPDEMQQHGNAKNMLDREQVNTYKKTPVMSGTEKGLTGTGSIKESDSSSEQVFRKNVDTLAKRIHKSLKESSSKAAGRYRQLYCTLVTESAGVVATPERNTLVEAAADLEEVLQFHKPENVTFLAKFKNSAGTTVLKQEVPMLTISSRGPLVSEGKALFRFKRNAEMFAEALAQEGHSSKIVEHSWGSAVKARVNYGHARQAYQAITEAKWISKAINPEHEGYCSPMSKSTCTPRRKALAKRFKKGGDLYSGKD